MRKCVLAFFLIILTGNYSICFGSDLRDNCGCGLGTIIFEGKDTLTLQIFAATFNAPSQLFGISSGTLGCEKPIEIVKSNRLNLFIASNMDNLAKDIATGRGEYLDVVVDLLDVPEVEKNVFYSRLQANFEVIFPLEKVTHLDVVRRIMTVYQAI